MTTIEWTHAEGYVGKTWNPVTGCSKVSPGCAHCYAEGIANRFWGDRKFTDVQFHADRLEEPLKWRKPAMVFVNSMSDLFHESVTDEQLDQIFAVMALTPQHTYQVLTKRPERMMGYFQQFSERAKEWGGDRWLIHETAKDIVGEDELYDGKYQHQKMCDLPLPNVWLGVTVENQKAADDRIPLLLKTPAAVRFLSCEPLLEQIDLRQWLHPVIRSVNGQGFLNGNALVGTDPSAQINWAIVGGESGPKARPCNITWIRSVVSQCQSASVPVFVKQLGSKPFVPVLHPGALLRMNTTGKGGNPEEWPEDLRVREFPATAVGVAV